MIDMNAIGHAATILLACGFLVWVWIIFKKLKKVHKRGQKARKRLMKYERRKRGQTKEN
jgi:hypothetical protein